MTFTNIIFDDVKHSFKRKFFDVRLIFLFNLIFEIRTTFFFTFETIFFFHFLPLKIMIMIVSK